MTPSTKVGTASFAGADMITLRAPAARWASASARVRNFPVDSSTTSTPRSAHGSAAGIGFREDADLLAVDLDAAVRLADYTTEAAVDTVVCKQVCERLRIYEVVDRDPLDVRLMLDRCAQGGAAYPSEPVDGYPYRHRALLSLVCLRSTARRARCHP